MAEAKPQRTRLSPQERRDQILAAAGRLAVDQGHLPVAPDALSREVQVSKGLIYNYFPTQDDLINALLHLHMTPLVEAVNALPARVRNQGHAAVAIYFEHVAAHGPLVHILISDLYSAGRLDPVLSRLRMRLLRNLCRRVRRRYALRPEECLTVVQLLIVLAEEAGSQVWQGKITLEVGRRLCTELAAGALEELMEHTSGASGRLSAKRDKPTATAVYHRA
ncbi:MAG: TetR/AcrR family transcriptional regulator [Caulobacteraceae bacterium]